MSTSDRVLSWGGVELLPRTVNRCLRTLRAVRTRLNAYHPSDFVLVSL